MKTLLKLRSTACVLLSAAVLFTACKSGDVIPMGGEQGGNGESLTDIYGLPASPATDEHGSAVDLDTSPVVVTDSDGNTIVIPTAEPGPSETAEPQTDEDGKVIPPKKNIPLRKKIGFIYRGNAEGNPTNEIFENARQKAHSDLGVETGFISQVLVQQFGDAVKTLAERDYNVVVAPDPAFANAALKAAKDNPTITFVLLGNTSRGGNITSINPLFYQSANVTGLAAAYASESGKIGVVGDPAMWNYHGVVDAFALGVRMVDREFTDVRVNQAYGENQRDTKAAIDNLIEGGCDVVFVYQNDDYGIRYCEERGVAVAGYGDKIPQLAPVHYLTGFYINVSGWLNENIRYMQNGEFRSGVSTGSVKDKLVGMYKLNPSVIFGGGSGGGTAVTADELQTGVIDVITKNIIEKDLVFLGELRDTNKIIRVAKGTALTYDDVFKVNWFADGITAIKDFSTSKSDSEIVYSDLQIRGEDTIDTAAADADAGAAEPR